MDFWNTIKESSI